MRYVTGDHHGLSTRVLEIRTNGSVREAFLKYLVEPPADFDPARKTQRLKGSCTVKTDPPPGTRIAWFSAGGSFNALQGAEASRTNNSMAYAVDEPGDFEVFYRSDIPAGQSHWHTNADVEVKLEEPARTVYVRYLGDPGLNNIRIYAHCLDEKKYAGGPVIITHSWTEGGAARSSSVRLEGPGEYDIECAADPVDESLEISVPSGGRG